jgi:hypothetical protein
MSIFFPPTPAEIKARLPLAAVCEALAILPDSSGRALCPFHNDHTPSFRLWIGVTGERWACDPCGKSGDHFDLVQRVLELSFPQATRWLLELAGRLPEDHVLPQFSLGNGGAPTRPWSNPDRARWSSSLLQAQGRGAEEPLLPYLLGFTPLDGGGDETTDATQRAWDDHLRAWGLGVDFYRNDPVAWIPHWDRHGVLTGIKTRRLRWMEPDGRFAPPDVQGMIKKAALPGSRFPDLYGAWLPPVHPVTLVVEGEPDHLWATKQVARHGLALNVYGLPRGAGSGVSPEWFEFLQGSAIWTAFDPDDAGERMTEKFALHGAQPFDFSPGGGYDLREVAPDLRQLVEHPVLQREEVRQSG